MARRNDTSEVGQRAEIYLAAMLRERGYNVTDLNSIRRNNETYDLSIKTKTREIKISVKCARAKRDISLGVPSSIRKLEHGTFLVVLLPSKKDKEIEFTPSGYDLWVVPADVVKHEAIEMHSAYWGADHSKLEANTVRVKDKIDTPGGRSTSGALFRRWSHKYKDAWHLLE